MWQVMRDMWTYAALRRRFIEYNEEKKQQQQPSEKNKNGYDYSTVAASGYDGTQPNYVDEQQQQHQRKKTTQSHPYISITYLFMFYMYAMVVQKALGAMHTPI